MTKRSEYVGKCSATTSVLFLLALVVFGACSTTHGPVPVSGVVTGKHETTVPGNASDKEKAHYFLWVKTQSGLVLVEVEEEVFQSVTEGEQVCVNCN